MPANEPGALDSSGRDAHDWRMNEPADKSALIVWLQLLGLLAGLAVVGAAVFWATRGLQR